jgi:hypothetical protein
MYKLEIKIFNNANLPWIVKNTFNTQLEASNAASKAKLYRITLISTGKVLESGGI